MQLGFANKSKVIRFRSQGVPEQTKKNSSKGSEEGKRTVRVDVLFFFLPVRSFFFLFFFQKQSDSWSRRHVDSFICVGECLFMLEYCRDIPTQRKASVST